MKPILVLACLLAALGALFLLLRANSGRATREASSPRPAPAAAARETPGESGTVEPAPGGGRERAPAAGTATAPAHSPEERRATTDEPPAPVVLAGRVLDDAGDPVAGARLRRLDLGAKDAAGTSERGAVLATTDGQGSFRVTGLASGPWALGVSSDEHPEQIERGLTERPGEIVSGLEFRLEPGAEIRGRVRGAPEATLGALWVRAVPERGEGAIPLTGSGAGPPFLEGLPRLARCAEDGGFVVRGVGRGSSQVLTLHRGARDVVGSSRCAPVIARAGESGVELVYRPGTALVFQAVDARTSEPVTELEVRLGHLFLTPLADEAGRIRRDFPSGRVRFEDLFERGRTEKTALVIVARGYRELRLDDLHPVDGQDLDLGILRLEPAPVLDVRVLDGETGAPVSGARVTATEPAPPIELAGHEHPGARARSPWLEGLSDREGRVRLDRPPGEPAQVLVSHADFAPALVEADPVSPGPAETTVRLRRGGNVSVEVVGADGAPVRGVRVERRAGGEGQAQGLPSQGLETDASGRLRFEHLAAGLHRFRVAPVAAGTAEAEWSVVSVSDRGDELLRLVLPSSARIHGRVTEQGLPLAGATLSFTSADGSSGTVQLARTDSRGEYVLERIDTGAVRVSVSHHSRAMPVASSLEVVAPDERFDLDLPVALIEGQVLDLEGQALADVRVEVRTAEGERSRPVFTDEHGRYSLRGLSCGVDLLVQASGRGLVPQESGVLRIEPGRIEPGIDFRVARGAALEVLVVSASADGTRWRVDAQPERGGPVQTESTDSRGNARFPCLAPGTWRIRIEGESSEGAVVQHSAPEQMVEVRLDSPNHVVFRVD